MNRKSRTFADCIVDFVTGVSPVVLDSYTRRIAALGKVRNPDLVWKAVQPIPDRALARKFQQLVDSWPQEPAYSAEALALSLEVAGRVHSTTARDERVELVWTGPAPALSQPRRTEQALLDVIEGARKELWLVSFAAYKLPSIGSALIRAAGRDVAVRLVVETPDESGGRVDFQNLATLHPSLAESVTVYVWPRSERETDAAGRFGSLHVKCALSDRHRLFVTSANLTEYAMNLNLELGLLVSGGNLPTALTHQLEWLVAEGKLIPANVR